MNLSDFDYELPEERIAQTPLSDRSASRLLVLDKRSGAVEHRMFSNVVDLLDEEDLLVLNDTRVTARRLMGRRASGGRVEALVLGPHGSGHTALTRPAKKLRQGDEIAFDDGFSATVLEDPGDGLKLLAFGDVDEASLLGAGTVPLPPYVRAQLDDEERYQTVYARSAGSAAAPTAGLHFTPELLSALAAKGVQTATVTLNVGLDTFRPLAVDDPRDHKMHGETCEVGEETVRKVSECRGRIVAVGTTTVRTLESASFGNRKLEAGRRETRLFIVPGYRFQTVDAMFTNFHLPRTTMLMMVSALASPESVLQAYREAVQERYRFLSFGDSMLIQ